MSWVARWPSNRGYSTGDPGDDLATASHPSYGEDGSAPLPPSDELANDPEAPDYTKFPDAAAEREAGIFVNCDDEAEEMKAALGSLITLQMTGVGGLMLIVERFALPPIPVQRWTSNSKPCDSLPSCALVFL
ncbi:hypothetical protein B0H14DRAFT_2624867 [Mycena olivaceomarginata]|nr:hypothetical protein B0H14DRAFT_2624867 [Mycena olivaceomarginata]